MSRRGCVAAVMLEVDDGTSDRQRQESPCCTAQKNEAMARFWLYFGVRFETQAEMEAWHFHPQHQAMQKQAYARCWSAVHLRSETSSTRQTFCAKRIQRLAVLESSEMERAAELLAHLTDFGAKPFETLTGEFEAQPYQLVGPLEIAPAPDAVLYSLITHWNVLADVQAI